MLKWKVSSPHLLAADLDSSLYSSSLAGSEESLVDCFNTNLRELMQDLQLGFSAAMTELSNIQDEDKVLHEKLDDSKHEQEVQMKDILEVVQSLKAQCEDIQYQLEISNKNQRKMERQIKKLKTEKHRFMTEDSEGDHRHTPGLDNRNGNNTYANGGDYTDVYTTSPMLKSYIANLPLPEEMEDIEDHHSDSDESLAAVTHKNLMLSNTLAQQAYGVQQPSSSNKDTPNGGDNSNNSSELSSKYESNLATEYHNGEALHEEKRTPNGHQPLSRMQVQRQRIAISIVDSERNYCTTLYNIIESYSKVLSSSGALSAKDCSRVFPSSLTAIYEYHCAVLKRLESRIIRWRQQDILGDIFGKFAVTKQVDIFAQYKNYIDNFAGALRAVRKLNKSSERFRSSLKICQRESGADNLSLISQLLVPVRRIPSLVLYIKKLLKYTDVDHPDRFFLESSLNTFRSSLLSMNESMERSIQMATSDCSSGKRSLETCSWSSHEEDQRLSTATKDSGIHSNCDLDSHGELSTLHFTPRVTNSSLKKSMQEDNKSDSASSSTRVSSARRPHSVLDFTRSEHTMTSMHAMTSSIPKRCKTPTAGMLNNRHSYIQNSSGLPLKPSLSHSTPNLLDDNYYPDMTMSLKRQQKTKHKVQFKNPPIEEHELPHHHSSGGKRVKRRTIADTLRIIFNRRKGGRSKNSNSDMSDSCCDLTSSLDEAPQTIPPHMFASHNSGSTPQLTSTQEQEMTRFPQDDTYEDENGDPYTVV